MVWKMPRRGKGRLFRLTSAVALGAVFVTGGVSLVPTDRADAITGSQASAWTSGLNSALGGAAKLFGEEAVKDVLPLNILMSLAGPLLSQVLGNGPSIQDVLDELKDVEQSIAEVKQSLKVIDEKVEASDLDTKISACTTQTEYFSTFKGTVDTGQILYGKVLDAANGVAVAASSGDARSLGQAQGLYRVAVNNFLDYTLGSSPRVGDVQAAPLAVQRKQVHDAMGTRTHPGVIQTCGIAGLASWKSDQNAKIAAGKVANDEQGAWVDDRDYYASIQDTVQYWQTIQSQGVYLLEQAALMQSTVLYNSDTGTTLPLDGSTACHLTSPEAPFSAAAKTMCSSGYDLTVDFHSDVVAELKLMGAPVSDDQVVLSLGSDVTGLTENGRSTASTAWARTQTATPDGGVGGPSTTASSYTFDNMAGFHPATGTQWADLVSAYRASHPAAPRNTQEPQATRGKSLYDVYGVAPFAPVDILSVMDASQGRAGDDARPKTFTASSDNQSVIWIPNETAAPTFPGFGFSDKQGLSFPSSWNLGNVGFVGYDAVHNDPGIGVRCMVIRTDGVVCGDSVKPWFLARQHATWLPNYTGRPSSLTITPSDPAAGTFNANASLDRGVKDPYLPYTITSAQSPAWVVPASLARTSIGVDATQVSGRTWAAAPAVTDSCPVTVWGVPTRCGAALNAYINSNVPDPAFSGPVATAAPRVLSADIINANVTCGIPTWADSSESSAPVIVSAPTWTATLKGQPSYSKVQPGNWRLPLYQLANEANYTFLGSSPPPFTATCSFTARYADRAEVATYVSPPANIVYGVLGLYVLSNGLGSTAPGAGSGSTPPPVPTPSPSAPTPPPTSSPAPSPTKPPSVTTPTTAPTATPVAGTDRHPASAKSTSEQGVLAFTGANLVPMVTMSVLLVLLGVVLIVRRRRQESR
jgi:hypothetical protein